MTEPDYSKIGAMGRAVNSASQRKASRNNGKLGGRPPKKEPCPDCGDSWTRAELNQYGRCPNCKDEHAKRLRLDKIGDIERQIQILDNFRATLIELARNLEKLREL